MWAFAKFSLILVTGMLGTTVAQESHQVRNEVSDGIREWQTILNRTFESSIMKIHTPEFPNLTLLACIMNGAPDATNAVVESTEIFFNSAAALMNETQQLLHSAANDRHNGLNTAIAASCHWSTTMNGLSKNFTDAFDPCLNSAERAHLELIYNVSSAISQYVCENNGERVSALFTADGRECITSSRPIIRNCTFTLLSRNTTIFENTEPSDYIKQTISGVFSPNTQACSEFQDVQQCIVGALQRCRYTIPSSEMNAFFNILKTTSGCDDFLRI